MDAWTMAEAKKDFERGLLTGFEFNDAAAVMSSDIAWNVSLLTSLSFGAGVLVDARTKQPRVFRTLDAALAAVRAVGFRGLVLQGK